MEPVSLQTNLDENYLARLDTMAIRELLKNAYLEIGTIAEGIFGIGEDAKIIEKAYAGKREQAPGKFGAHIGYEPAVKPGNEIDITGNSIFYDRGAGELGRLVSSYIYWSVIDAKGMAELNMPAWDKRIWNDEGSSFKSPSIRSAFQVVNTIAATVVSAVFTFGASLPTAIGVMALGVGINTSDDLFFGTLDVAFGYKTFDEAGFEFGKALLTETASSVVSGLFGGIGSAGTVLGNGLTKTAMNAANTTIGKVMVQTAMTGAQTLATGFVNSAINGITYSRNGGLGYSGEMFSTGMRSTFTNSLSSMANTFTAGTLQAVNSGFSLEKLAGFNNTNKADIGKLNSLAGSLVGQGVNYAMGDAFTLNVLNLGLFTNGKTNSGLLELHLGRDGTTMNIGTGGTNVSLDNLAASLRGAQVWNVNSNIGRYVKNNYFDSAISLRAQYGFGDSTQKGQLWDILKGGTGIQTNTGENLFAETTIVDGRRMINLTGYRQGMSAEEQMRLAVLLGHEAYRDGVVTDDNNLETRTATLAHTEMALRMLFDGQQLAFDDNLIKDIIAYIGGADFFNAYVDNNYDSSGDFWRIMLDANREVTRVLWDSDYTNATIVNADGTERTVPIQSGSVMTALAAAVGNGITPEQMNRIMVASGLDFDHETMKWFPKDESSKYKPPTQAEIPQPMETSNINSSSKWSQFVSQAKDMIRPVYNGTRDFFSSAGDWLTNSANKVRNWLSSIRSRPQENNWIEPNNQNETGNYVTVPDGFFGNIMNNDIMYQYSKENNGGIAQCNTYVKNMILAYFGSKTHENIFQGKDENANAMFSSFEKTQTWKD